MYPVLTTHEVAELCHVSEITAIRWIDGGKLKGHKTPGGHRRVFREDMEEFLKKSGTPSLKRNRTILIIEDDRRLAETLEYYIGDQRPSYKIEIANDGFEGLALIGKYSPALILLDIGLPKINGIELCKKVKSGTLGCNPPIIVLTGNIMAKNETDYLQENTAHIFEKPIADHDFFLEVIDQTIRYKGKRRKKTVS